MNEDVKKLYDLISDQYQLAHERVKKNRKFDDINEFVCGMEEAYAVSITYLENFMRKWDIEIPE